MVEHFQEMVERLLVAWYDQPQHKRFPANVLYYRDGIAKSQYAELEQTEIPAIRNAFEKVAKDKKVAVPPFNLTTIIVTKRHNTRLFPSMEKDAMNKNGPLLQRLLPPVTQRHQRHRASLPLLRAQQRDWDEHGSTGAIRKSSLIIQLCSTLIPILPDPRALPHLRPRNHGRLLRPTSLLRRPSLRGKY
jgi:hypothetical protein